MKWRLGGKRSDFQFLPGAAFNYQHDVRRHADGTLTIFDNGAFAPGLTVEPFTRPIRLSLDMNAMTATLVEEYLPATPRVSWAMGNVQQLPDDGVFVGWGTAGAFTEFDSAGGVRFDASFADASISYRAFRSPWTAKPTGHPAVVVAPNPNGTLTGLRELERRDRGRRVAGAWGRQSGRAQGRSAPCRAPASRRRSRFPGRRATWSWPPSPSPASNSPSRRP